MTAHEFTAWGKTPRLFRSMVITEKIDGTNAAINVGPDGEITAQSRTRIVTPEKDNHGFARWAHENGPALGELLGEGLHFGEWWGQGIQRNYGLTEKRFSLFNAHRHKEANARIGGVLVAPVPVLFQGVFSTPDIGIELNRLAVLGSFAAPGFPNPEGICVYHAASRQIFKVTLDGDDAGKWEATS